MSLLSRESLLVVRQVERKGFTPTDATPCFLSSYVRLHGCLSLGSSVQRRRGDCKTDLGRILRFAYSHPSVAFNLLLKMCTMHCRTPPSAFFHIYFGCLFMVLTRISIHVCVCARSGLKVLVWSSFWTIQRSNWTMVGSPCPDGPGSWPSDAGAATRGQQSPQKQCPTRLQRQGPWERVPFMLFARWPGVHLNPDLVPGWAG